MKDFSAGDKVSWNTSQGRTYGEVVRKITSEMMIKTHRVAASKDNPQYLVESYASGAQAARKPSALTKEQ